MKLKIVFTITFVVLLLFISKISFASSITIDAVHGTWDDNGVMRILPNEEVSFDIRFTNNSGYGITGFANGYRIWTTGGTNFTPVSVEILDPYFPSYFDLVFAINIYSDGILSDTVGIGGSILGTALPNGYDTLAYKIITGGVQEGETLCIDSTFYGQTGVWRWSTTSGDIFPTWSGQQCFTAMCAGGLVSFTNCVDTLKITDGNTISYDYDANGFVPAFAKFYIVDGPGTIDTLTGEWTHTVSPAELGTIDTLKIGAYQFSKCLTIECWTILDFSCNVPADMNGDCSSDISDLVMFVAYMFQDGPPPEPLMSADMNGDGTIDIADLVWLVEYMFNGGPPPIG